MALEVRAWSTAGECVTIVDGSSPALSLAVAADGTVCSGVGPLYIGIADGMAIARVWACRYAQ